MDSPHAPECSVCEECYDEGKRVPRSLGCGHTFCHQCLVEIAMTSPSVSINAVLCPSCRESHPLAPLVAGPNRKELAHQKITLLTKNFALLSLMGAAAPKRLASAPSSPVVAAASSKRLCSDHRRELEFWCGDCMTMRCTLCIAMAACRKHSQPLHLNDDTAVRTLLSQHVAMAQSASAALSAAAARLDDVRQSVDASHTSALAEICKARSRLLELVNAACDCANEREVMVRDTAAEYLSEKKRQGCELVDGDVRQMQHTLDVVTTALNTSNYDAGLCELNQLGQCARQLRALAADPTLRELLPAHLYTDTSEVAKLDRIGAALEHYIQTPDESVAAPTASVFKPAAAFKSIEVKTAPPRKAAVDMPNYELCGLHTEEINPLDIDHTYYCFYTSALEHSQLISVGDRCAAVQSLGSVGSNESALIAPMTFYTPESKILTTPKGFRFDLSSLHVFNITSCAVMNDGARELVYVMYNELSSTHRRHMFHAADGQVAHCPYQMTPCKSVATDGTRMFSYNANRINVCRPGRPAQSFHTGKYNVNELVANSRFVVLNVNDCLVVVPLVDHEEPVLSERALDAMPKSVPFLTQGRLALKPNADVLTVVRQNQTETYGLAAPVSVDTSMSSSSSSGSRASVYPGPYANVVVAAAAAHGYLLVQAEGFAKRIPLSDMRDVDHVFYNVPHVHGSFVAVGRTSPFGGRYVNLDAPVTVSRPLCHLITPGVAYNRDTGVLTTRNAKKIDLSASLIHKIYGCAIVSTDGHEYVCLLYSATGQIGTNLAYFVDGKLTPMGVQAALYSRVATDGRNIFLASVRSLVVFVPGKGSNVHFYDDHINDMVANDRCLVLNINGCLSVMPLNHEIPEPSEKAVRALPKTAPISTDTMMALQPNGDLLAVFQQTHAEVYRVERCIEL